MSDVTLPTPTSACVPTREALSAQLDGETSSLPLAEAQRHAASCTPCGRFGAQLATVTRRVRVAAADAVPDLTAPILVALAEDRAGVGLRRLRDLRVVIGLAGVVQLVLAMPVLFGLTVGVHLGRDLGALELALGVGFLVAAYQPHRASGVLPIAAAAFGVVMVAAVFDVTAGRAALVGELGHLSELVGVLALWTLTRWTAADRRTRLALGV